MLERYWILLVDKGGKMGEITERIAKFIFETDYEKVPQGAIKLAKESILDNLSCMILGSVQPVGKLITEFVHELGGEPESSIVGANFKTNAPYAALANGVLAHSLDYDDSIMTAITHPSSSLVPATLAIGEKEKISGKKFLEAYIVGIEVLSKVGSVITPGANIKGWHTAGIFGSIGCAAATAKILNLSNEEIKTALSIAASMASGLSLNFGSMTKSLHLGLAARNGIMAGILAKKGFTANESPFDGTQSFFEMFKGETGCNLAKVDSIGDIYDITTFGGPAIKPYACCYGIFPQVSATLEIIKKHPLTPEEIDTIEAYQSAAHIQPMLCSDYIDGGRATGTYTGPPRQIAPSIPKAGLEGKFSIEYCLARAIMDGELGLKQFTNEKVLEPKAQEFLRKVKVYQDVELERIVQKGWAENVGPVIIKIKLKNGEELVGKEEYIPGSPRKPLSEKEKVNKVRDCALIGGMSEEEIERVSKLVENLEKLSDITELIEVIAAK